MLVKNYLNIEEDSTKLKSVEFGIFSSLLNKNAASEYIEQSS